MDVWLREAEEVLHVDGSSFVNMISGMLRLQLSPGTGESGPSYSAGGLQYKGLNS